MIREIFSNQYAANKLFIAAIVLAALNTQAFAAISKPETAASPTSPPAQVSEAAAAETSAILNQASFIVFEGAKALETVQKSMNSYPDVSDTLQKSEIAQNFIKSIQYSPKKVALPSDADVLDEPWEISSTAGTINPDGLVIPHLGPASDDDDDANLIKGMDIGSPTEAVQKFLRLLKPVQNAVVTSPFGFRWGRPHQGIDMAAPVGTPIVAAEQGRVVYSGWKQGYGNFVAVDHGHGVQTHYAHCSKLLVHVGAQVKKGTLIAKVGNTGNSTGPHLHFEVVANGIHRNPVKYLNHSLAVVQATK